jgi:23S rRNA (guanosine2251-2'-O)-methyltransferase
MTELIVIAHNIRSTHNVGSLFRTCEGFGVSRLLLTGYTPYPTLPHDTRLPHLSDKLTVQIHKTALGAESLVPHEHYETPPLNQLKTQGYHLLGLEQDPRAIPLGAYNAPDKIALLIGEEVAGIEASLRDQCDSLIEIPMHGKKESFNVAVATGIALYGLTSIS